jgi:hypothetical protein
MLMIHTDIICARGLGNNSVRGIAPPGIFALSFLIEGAIVFKSDTPGANRRDGAIG